MFQKQPVDDPCSTLGQLGATWGHFSISKLVVIKINVSQWITRDLIAVLFLTFAAADGVRVFLDDYFDLVREEQSPASNKDALMKDMKSYMSHFAYNFKNPAPDRSKRTKLNTSNE